MKRKIEAWLWDVRNALEMVVKATDAMDVDAYRRDQVVKAAVERQFITIGEALNRIRREQPDLLDHIESARKIIGFRNVLVHGYDIIKDDIVWRIIKEDVPVLLAQSQELLESN